MNNLVNSVNLIGNLGSDVDFKVVGAKQNKLARVNLATNDVSYDQNGQKQVETQWHTIVGWGKIAERMQVFGKKGKRWAIQGKLEHRSFEDPAGNKRYYTEVVVREFMMLN